MVRLALCACALAILAGCATWKYSDYAVGTDPSVVAAKRDMTVEKAVDCIRSVLNSQAKAATFGEEGKANVWCRAELTRCDATGYTYLEHGALRFDQNGQIVTVGVEQCGFMFRNTRYMGESSFTVTNDVRFAEITHLKISSYGGVPCGVQAYTGTNLVFSAAKSNETLAALAILCPNVTKGAGQGK